MVRLDKAGLQHELLESVTNQFFPNSEASYQLTVLPHSIFE